MLVYQRVSWPGTHGNFAARQMAIVRGIGAMLGNVIIFGTWGTWKPVTGWWFGICFMTFPSSWEWNNHPN